VGGGSDVKLRGGSFSRLAVIELLSELILLIGHVGASLGQFDTLLLMMTHSGWELWAESICVLRENSTKLVVDVCD
jgi:hypothetical protein